MRDRARDWSWAVSTSRYTRLGVWPVVPLDDMTLKTWSSGTDRSSS